MAQEIHVDDIGTRFVITVKDDEGNVDLTESSIRQLTFRKPSDEYLYRTAEVFGDGSESSGVMYYDVVSGDFDEPGLYKLQGKVSTPSGVYYTDTYSFKVHCNI